MLAERAPQPAVAAGTRWYAPNELSPQAAPLEDSMLFVIDGDGATKIVRERHWGRYIRRLRRGEDEDSGRSLNGEGAAYLHGGGRHD